jgi:hypothetical protein
MCEGIGGMLSRIREELVFDPDWPGIEEISKRIIVMAEDNICLVIMIIRS